MNVWPQFQMTDEIEGAIFARDHPSSFGWPLFGIANVIHYRCPSSIFHHRISRRQIGPRHLQAGDGFTMGLVLGEEQTLGLGLVTSTKARLLLGGDVLDEVAPALSSK